MPLSTTVLATPIVLPQVRFAHLCSLPGHVAISVSNLALKPKIRAGGRPTEAYEWWRATAQIAHPKPYHRQPRFHNSHPTSESGCVPHQQSQIQQSSSKSSGSTRQMVALARQEGKGGASATAWGGQCKYNSASAPQNRNNDSGKLRQVSHPPITSLRPQMEKMLEI